VQNVKFLAFAGHLGYQFLLSLNPLINFVGRRFGLSYWSRSAYAKKKSERRGQLHRQIRKAIVRYDADFSVGVALCGHNHSASIRQFQNIKYYNCGDWLESCTALVEHMIARLSW
jgi:UDP-2,3-diacylglucosamine pyrophosphatase LpxH